MTKLEKSVRNYNNGFDGLFHAIMSLNYYKEEVLDLMYVDFDKTEILENNLLEEWEKYGPRYTQYASYAAATNIIKSLLELIENSPRYRKNNE